MARIDINDPRWIAMVFEGRNQEYGAYQLRMETAKRNLMSLGILIAVALIAGGIIAYQLSRPKEIYADEWGVVGPMEIQNINHDKPEQVKPKVEPRKEIPVARQTQKFVAPVIKIDAEVNEENMLKQMDQLDEKAAVGVTDIQGTTDRTTEAIRNDIAVATPPPAPKEEVKEVVNNTVFRVVEVMPSFPGGNSQLMQYLTSNTRYPVVAQENGVEGRVVVSFVVERDGSITDISVVKSVDPSLDREAMRVVKSMPKWIAGRQNGQAVRVKFNVPVTFRLQH